MVMNTRALDRAEAVSDTRVRTLVVDDSPFMLKILAQILQEAGNFDLVGTATNGCQALRYVSMLSPELVVMDVHMPRLNGIQATRYIKQREHPPVVIIMTSDDSSVVKATAEDAGADAFVSKESNLRQQLMGALQNLFGTSGERREAAGGISFQNSAHERPRAEHVTSPVLQRSQPAQTFFGKRTAPACECPPPIEQLAAASAPLDSSIQRSRDCVLLHDSANEIDL